MLKNSRRHMRLHTLVLVALIGSSSNGAVAQDAASDDCELAVAAMINLAQTNLANSEAMVQLSIDKLGLLTSIGGQANADMVEAMSAMDETLDGVEQIDSPVVAGGIAAMRRMCPDAFPQN
ncbi:MAG: hypothetical protein ACRBB0_19615 [Pelagimonas sp.]|uniref:hypothetical protein n=1 Tax=Pelagimonas sp. TaxID=2073170 RepID=UPI003D6A43B8